MSLADISTGEMESSSSEEEDDFEDVSPPKKDVSDVRKTMQKDALGTFFLSAVWSIG